VTLKFSPKVPPLNWITKLCQPFSIYHIVLVCNKVQVHTGIHVMIWRTTLTPLNIVKRMQGNLVLFPIDWATVHISRLRPVMTQSMSACQNFTFPPYAPNSLEVVTWPWPAAVSAATRLVELPAAYLRYIVTAAYQTSLNSQRRTFVDYIYSQRRTFVEFPEYLRVLYSFFFRTSGVPSLIIYINL
jgi:hypothetical protein